MYCRFCGQQIPDESIFCLKCGNVQDFHEFPISPAQEYVVLQQEIPAKKKFAKWIIAAVAIILVLCGGAFYIWYAMSDPSVYMQKDRGTETGTSKNADSYAAAREQGIIFSADGKTLLKCPVSVSGRVVIPAGVTIIEDEAFLGV